MEYKELENTLMNMRIEYSIRDFKKAVQMDSLEEAVEYLVKKDNKKEVCPELAAYMEYCGKWRQAKEIAKSRAQVGETLSAEDIAAEAKTEIAIYTKWIENLYAEAEPFHQKALEWAKSCRVKLPEWGML